MGYRAIRKFRSSVKWDYHLIPFEIDILSSMSLAILCKPLGRKKKTCKTEGLLT